MNNNKIEGKVVVITGASSGLGESTARLLSAQGASVVLGARRVDRLRSLVDELTGSGGKALSVSTEVTYLLYCIVDAPNKNAISKHHQKFGLKCDWITEVKTTA